MTFSFVFTGTVSPIDEKMEDSRKEEAISTLVPIANIFPAFYSQYLSTAKCELFYISMFFSGSMLYILHPISTFLLINASQKLYKG